MFEHYAVDHVATILLLTSYWALGSKKRWGFALNVIGSAFMVALGVLINSPALIIGNLAFMVFGVRGYMNWRENV